MDQTMKPYLLLLITPFLFAMVDKAPLNSEDERKERPRAGGPCEYHRYEGSAEITSLRKTVDPYKKNVESYEVKFRFIPASEIKESFARVTNREFLLEIGQSSYLSPEFVKQHDVQVGRTFRGYLLVITRGTCTPVQFEFPVFSSK
jgi:hypothetical protein